MKSVENRTKTIEIDIKISKITVKVIKNPHFYEND